MARIGVVPGVEFGLRLRVQRLAAAADDPARGLLVGARGGAKGVSPAHADSARSQASRMRIMCFSTALTEIARRSAMAR